MKKENQKIKLLKIWEILRTDSDEDNTISTTELIARLADDGINAERKSVYDDIRTLIDWGYPVECKRSRVNEYFVRDADFTTAELRVLMDSVQAANFVSQQNAKVLTYKIASLAGSNKGEILADNTELGQGKRKTDASWEAITQAAGAIQRRHKLAFRYFDYDINKSRVYRTRSSGSDLYVVNPWALVCREDNYYLICHMDDREGYTTYRLDRMADVCIAPDRRETPAWVRDYPASRYRKETFGMYSGDKVRVNLLCKEDRKVIDLVLDRFGFDTALKSLGDGRFYVAVTVQLSPPFFAWLTSVSGMIQLVSPEGAKEGYRRYLADAMSALEAQ
ncbi:MAG: WYL domain-containing protein [Clostridia bacterium]|nr:WYL domain-containing protein [Clostridia bacterium]